MTPAAREAGTDQALEADGAEGDRVFAAMMALMQTSPLHLIATATHLHVSPQAYLRLVTSRLAAHKPPSKRRYRRARGRAKQAIAVGRFVDTDELFA